MKQKSWTLTANYMRSQTREKRVENWVAAALNKVIKALEEEIIGKLSCVTFVFMDRRSVCLPLNPFFVFSMEQPDLAREMNMKLQGRVLLELQKRGFTAEIKNVWAQSGKTENIMLYVSW